MKGPGPFKLGTSDHSHLMDFNKMMAKRFRVSESAMLGILVKLNDKMCEAVHTEAKLGSLVIETIETGVK